MGKQIYERIRKTLSVLLLFLCVASLAATSISAAASVYGDKSDDSYTRGYWEGYSKGYNTGFTDGIAGKSPRMFLMIYYGPDSGYNGGYYNGFRDGYGAGYNAGRKLYSI